MQREVAEIIINMMQEHMRNLNESVRLVQERCSAEEFKSYRRGIGHIFAEMGERIMDPIYREHRDLLPEGIEYTPGPGPTLSEKK